MNNNLQDKIDKIAVEIEYLERQAVSPANEEVKKEIAFKLWKLRSELADLTDIKEESERQKHREDRNLQIMEENKDLKPIDSKIVRDLADRGLLKYW